MLSQSKVSRSYAASPLLANYSATRRLFAILSIGTLHIAFLAICDACLSAYVGVPFRASAARNRVLGAATTANDKRARAAQCQRIDSFRSAYRADELRQLATTYRFIGDEYSPLRRHYTCTFDSADEPCAWYRVEPPNPDGGIVGNSVEAAANRHATVRRARFETFFDFNRFDCTSDRGFPFNEQFLMIGADEGTMADESSVALEARIPCQHQNAILKFDYWSINETPVLKVCVLLESNLLPQCEESRLDANPLTFEIPRSEAAFRLRVQVDHLGTDDVVLIDNFQYSPPPSGDASDCRDRSHLSPPPMGSSVGRLSPLTADNNDLSAATTMFPLLAALLSPTPPPSTFSLFPTASPQQPQPAIRVQRRRLTSSPLLSSDFRPPLSTSFITEAAVSTTNDENSDERPLSGEAFGGGNGGVPKKFPSTAELVDENWEQTDSRRAPPSSPQSNDVRATEGDAGEGGGENDVDSSLGDNTETDDDISSTQSLSACQALTCDFNAGDACFYTRSGAGGTAEWRIGNGAVGNPHTGIHRPNPIDVSNWRSGGSGGVDSSKMSPFAYVGVDANDLYGEVFVLESSRFSLSLRDEPIAFLLFDLFQRSVGPLLKVCINDFTDCPYSNPVLTTRQHWHLDQRVPLNASSEVVYFIAGQLRQNQFLAIDNIRLENADGEELQCD